MQQLLSTWFAIDNRKRIIAMTSFVAMFAAIIGLSRLATAPTMTLLYSGLSPASAGDVIKALEQRGVPYEVRGNAIMVDSAQRDQLRLALASEGLPADEGKGYELLDSLTGFGTTAQMFDAAYWRAKEGELARTIVASPQFRQARVHISNVVTTPFRKTAHPTASVTVTGTSGAISAANAKALKYLVASAVAGMTVDDVAIIDGRNGVVVRDDDQMAEAAGSSDRAQSLKQNVQRLLEAHVGAGNVLVEVALDTSNESEKLYERRLDPDSRVAISSRKEERTGNSTNSGSGAVTVASNLPAGNAAGGGENSSSQNQETVETQNYEVSETTREVMRAPGTIRRISVAVLVNDVARKDPDTGEISYEPRSGDEIAALKELVTSAVGLDPERGDTITIKSMPFEAPPVAGEVAEASLFQGFQLDLMRLIQMGVLAVVSLILGLFVLRPILASGPAVADQTAVAPQGLPSPEAEPGQPPALTGEIAETAPSDVDSQPDQPSLPDTVSVDPVQRLREMIADRQEETVEIIRSWMDEAGEHS